VANFIAMILFGLIIACFARRGSDQGSASKSRPT
jgi:hypothetical protein